VYSDSNGLLLLSALLQERVGARRILNSFFFLVLFNFLIWGTNNVKQRGF
jgi:hypothetical protein